MPYTSYYFTEIDAFTATTQAQCFGPISEDVFNITTGFTLTAEKKAFAICKGVVLIQPQTESSDKVNLILRPFKQPFPDITVKYFIYRGLKKSDFFTTAANPNISPSGSDFINKINANFQSFFTSHNATVPDFKATFIGYNENVTQVPLDTTISDLFFKETVAIEDGSGNTTESPALAFELPMAEAGMWLGNFASGDCGIDVVLDYGDYKQDFDNGEFVFDLNYARKAFATIDIGSLTGLQTKRIREQSTQFIDIVAYYGMFVKEGKVTFTDASNVVTSKEGQAIYTDLLMPFANKNKVYLYIDSNRNRSYNFYNNYCVSQTNSNSIKVGLANVLLETTFGNLNWPLCVFELDQNNSNDFNDISIQVIASSTYEEIALFVLTGEVVTESDRGFIVKENLLEIQNSTQDLNFSKVLSFKVPNIEANGHKKNISTIIKLIYVGNGLNFSGSSSSMLWEDKKRYLLYHNIFSNITISPVFNNDENFLISSVNKPKLISYKGFSNFMNESVLNSYVVFHEGKKVVVNTDLSTETYIKEKTLFIAKKIDTLDDFSIHQPKVLTKGAHSTKMFVDSSVSDYSNYFSTLYGSIDYSLKHFIIDDVGVSIKILSLDIGSQFDYCFYNLGITKDELNILKGIIPINSSNVDFYLQDNLDNPHINTVTKAPFFKYSLGIIYENSSGTLSVLMPQNPIYVYGFSNSFLASKEYSEYEEKSILEEEYNEINIS